MLTLFYNSYPLSIILVNQCGQRIKGNNGVLTNPSAMLLSSEVDSNLCVWIIESKPLSHMRLDLRNVDLTGDCDTSYLLIREGEHSSSPIINKYCGYTAFSQEVSRKNKIWVEYKTPTANIGRFVLKWTEYEGRGKIRFIFTILINCTTLD